MRLFKKITLDVTLLNDEFYKGEAEFIYNIESTYPEYTWRKLDANLWEFLKKYVETECELHGHSEAIDGDYMTSVTAWTFAEDNES